VKAQNLTISMPNKGCDKKCPYCVSHMTGFVKADRDLMRRKAMKILTLVEAAGVYSVLMTSKGEPFLNWEDLSYFIRRFKKFEIEVQTNGIWLKQHADALFRGAYASMKDIDVIAFSIDRLEDLAGLKDICSKIKSFGGISRASVNITSLIPQDTRFDALVEKAKEAGFQQLSLRNIVAPDNAKDDAVKRWIENNVNPKQYEALRNEMTDTLITKKQGRPLRSLPFGAVVYGYKDMSITFFDYCIQDYNTGEDIRSLIFLEDGHVYTAWNDKASILF
jgi:molybdenum cofactor biosynthesis enzyme MoaA